MFIFFICLCLLVKKGQNFGKQWRIWKIIRFAEVSHSPHSSFYHFRGSHDSNSLCRYYTSKAIKSLFLSINYPNVWNIMKAFSYIGVASRRKYCVTWRHCTSVHSPLESGVWIWRDSMCYYTGCMHALMPFACRLRYHAHSHVEFTSVHRTVMAPLVRNHNTSMQCYTGSIRLWGCRDILV